MAALVHSELMPPWRISVEGYHILIERGIIGPDDKLELLDGVIVEKMPEKPPHTYATDAAQDALRAVLPAGWILRVQHPITLQTSEPEPDLAVARGVRRDYTNRHPGPGDLALIVEAADSSLNRDHNVKRRIYAGAGIPYYWLLDLNGRRLEIYSNPRNGDYGRADFYGPGDSAPVILDGVEVGFVSVSALLP